MPADNVPAEPFSLWCRHFQGLRLAGDPPFPYSGSNLPYKHFHAAGPLGGHHLSILSGRCLEAIYRQGYEYKKAGVIISGIVPDHQVQQNLFEPAENDCLLRDTIDKLNARFGNGKVQVASAGTKKEWKLIREMLSPHYSTSFLDVIKVVSG